MAYRKAAKGVLLKPPVGAGVDFAHPLGVGLVGCWLFNERAGGLASDMVRGTRSVITNGPTWGAVGVGGAGLRFDATNDYFELGRYRYITAGKPFSLSWWEWIVADTDTFISRFMLGVTSGTFQFGVGRIKDSGTYGRMLWGPYGDSGNIKSSTIPAPVDRVGRWAHFVITGTDPTSKVSANYAIYCDGVSYATADSSPGAAAGAINRIGYHGAATGFTGPNAVLDNVRIYNRRLTQGEAQALFSQPYAGIWTPRRRIHSGVAPITGALAVTLDSTTLSSAGTVLVSGSANLAPAASLSSTGTVAVSGAAALSPTGSVSGAGTVDVSGASSLSPDASLASAGGVAVSGAAALAPAGSVSGAAGVEVSGSCALAPACSSSSAGAVLVTGAASFALEGASLEAAGGLVGAPIVGDASLTLAGASLAATGYILAEHWLDPRYTVRARARDWTVTLSSRRWRV